MKNQEAQAIHVLAYVLQQNAQPAKAAMLLEALDAIAPDDTQTLTALAAAQLKSLESARALETLERIGDHHHAAGVVDLLRAQALARLGRIREAQAAMQAFLVRRPKSQQGREG